MSKSGALLEELVVSCRILVAHDILQDSGSISVRNPRNTSSFIVNDLPAALTTSVEHLRERSIADGSLIPQVAQNTDDTRPEVAFTEPLVHSSIYARYADVQCVIHSQSSNSIIYGLCNAVGSMLLPAHNKAGFLAKHCPIFNPADFYNALPDSSPRDLRISHSTLGEAMAERLLSHDNYISNGPRHLPDYGCILLRGNGMAVWGRSLYETVHKAIHFERNAFIQTAAMLQRTHSDLEVTYLTDREAEDSEEKALQESEILWRAWAAKVGAYDGAA
ncbi:uncharacterized protein HMPREF1541_07799 [Cyphellophora europaea CBS 101466]|uniref:Class II aldolase/adducin N-terminal domain-containing protein n=1 Tax=Cyphellophora europaea (strain CBS 101466) TaxID=1220924 RepID=W2RK11_CYPE1|nr:uncharacterized protein HMPREF1541_07799 [Cyphellophora europaea CBS 101466]ETN36812.1 hypothetical protein HMPREF1541_07799 [Cyphellophora europaea CBS 101466]